MASPRTREDYVQMLPEILRNDDNDDVFCIPCDSKIGNAPSRISRHLSHRSHESQVNAIKLNTSPRLASIVEKYACFKIVDGQLFCEICMKRFRNPEPDPVKHMKTKWHRDCQKLNKKFTQDATYQEFITDLTAAFTATNIPLAKLDKPEIKELFAKYTGRKIPTANTIRRVHLPKLADQYRSEIIDYLQDKKIFVSIDETTDRKARQVAAVIVGTLELDENGQAKPGKVFLFDLVQLEATNNVTIAELFRSVINQIWPNGNNDAVLLFVTDGASYMLKAGDTLRKEYTKMIHVTCIAHGIHRLSLAIAAQFSAAKKAIMKTKAVFLNSPKRKRQFKEAFPGIPLPPYPADTRWGTFLAATVYFAKYFDQVRFVIRTFDDGEPKCLEAQNALTDEAKVQLEWLAKHYSYLAEIIKMVQTRNMPLSESIELTRAVRKGLKPEEWEDMSADYRKKAEAIQLKWENVIKRNPGLNIIGTIELFIRPSRTDNYFDAIYDQEYIDYFKEHILPFVTEEEWQYLGYGPIGSTDVERAFSYFSNVFTQLRRNSKVESLKSLLIIQWNHKGLESACESLRF